MTNERAVNYLRLNKPTSGYPGLCEAIDIAIAALAAPPPDETRCQWTEDDDAVWHTDCGAAWQFEAGGPTANRMKFCHNCGKALRAKPAKGDR